MKPIRTDNTNKTFKLPGGTEENDLPVVVAQDEYGPTIRSTWALTEFERQTLARGGQITLTVWGAGHPPVLLGVQTPQDPDARYELLADELAAVVAERERSEREAGMVGVPAYAERTERLRALLHFLRDPES